MLLGEGEVEKGIRAKLLRTSAARVGTWREDAGDQAESDCGLRERELSCPHVRSAKERVPGVRTGTRSFSERSLFYEVCSLPSLSQRVCNPPFHKGHLLRAWCCGPAADGSHQPEASAGRDTRRASSMILRTWP